jgi:uncharacterized protein YbjT (DUF2867 family)
VTDPVLVLGATGTQGGAVARGLLAAGFPVRALVRDAGSARAQELGQDGAELVQGDLDDAGSLARAFAQAAVVYAITTPFAGGAQEEERQGENIVAAASDAELPWLVLASVAAADRAPVPHFASKARIEQRLRETSVPWTVIAPSYFYENVLGARDAIRLGTLPIAVPPDKPLHQVALKDLGALVAAVLHRKAEHIGARVEVADDDPTPTDMAAAIGVRYEHVPLARVRERSQDLAAMYEFLSAQGYGIDVEALRRRYPEVAWTRFAEWARGIDWA